eukprot:5614055-Prymnesium_polylepis.1
MTSKLLAVALAACMPVASARSCSAHTTGSALVHERRYDLTGKVAVMTGSDGGIGLGGAVGLAAANATVILLSHHPESKGADAAAAVARQTGNPKVFAIGVDLASLASVRAAAASVLALSARVDVLVCSAGVNAPPRGYPITADGFEFVLQVMVLGHAYLTRLLLPALRESRGRVISTASTVDLLRFDAEGRVRVVMDVCPANGLATNCTDLAALREAASSARPPT